MAAEYVGMICDKLMIINKRRWLVGQLLARFLAPWSVSALMPCQLINFQTNNFDKWLNSSRTFEVRLTYLLSITML